MDEVIRDFPEKTERTEATEETDGTERTDGTEETEGGSQLPLWPEEAAPVALPAGPPETPASPGPPPPLEPLGLPGRWGRIWRSPAPLWSLADLGSFVLFAAFSFFLANAVAVGVFFLLQQSFAWNLTIEEAFVQPPLVISMQTAWEMLWLAFIYFTVTGKYGRRFWEAIQWKRGPHPGAAYLIAGVALALLAQVFFYVSPSEKELPIEKLFTNAEAGFLLAVFGIAVAPFIEELVFRGFFYPVFESHWGLRAGVFWTAFLFALVHSSQLWGGWQEIAAIFVVGLVFSYCRGKTGSLIPSFLMHLGYNAALFGWLYLSTDHFRALKG